MDQRMTRCLKLVLITICGLLCAMASNPIHADVLWASSVSNSETNTLSESTESPSPVWYEGIKAEHAAVRESCGIFDTCHMGRTWATGSDVERFLNYVITNDLNKLEQALPVFGRLLRRPIMVMLLSSVRSSPPAPIRVRHKGVLQPLWAMKNRILGNGTCMIWSREEIF